MPGQSFKAYTNYIHIFSDNDKCMYKHTLSQFTHVNKDQINFQNLERNVLLMVCFIYKELFICSIINFNSFFSDALKYLFEINGLNLFILNRLKLSF